jgi:hypothetical protein
MIHQEGTPTKHRCLQQLITKDMFRTTPSVKITERDMTQRPPRTGESN